MSKKFDIEYLGGLIPISKTCNHIILGKQSCFLASNAITGVDYFNDHL